MTTVKEIENAIKSLPPGELKQFRAWFADFDAKTWDAQIEKDIESGKLGKIADQAKISYQNGKFRRALKQFCLTRVQGVF
jgi:hypothetical protein